MKVATSQGDEDRLDAVQRFIDNLRRAGWAILALAIIGALTLLAGAPDCEQLSTGSFSSVRDCSDRDAYRVYAFASLIPGIVLTLGLFTAAHVLAILARIEVALDR